MSRRGSRYILGHLSFADMAALPVGAVGSLILNPDEPKALFEASKSIKAAFVKAGKGCIIKSHVMLIELEPKVWKQTHLVMITCTERDGGAQ